MTDTSNARPAPIAQSPEDCLLSTLESLPEELLQLVASYLPSDALKNAALVSSTLNRHATDFLWQHVCLADQWTSYYDPNEVRGLERRLLRARQNTDEHDDTPIIQKLFILATNPTIASKVHALTHRCHLPPPNIFDELPNIHFHSETLSRDNRIHELLRLAVHNMVNVQTLRIVYGHMMLASSLVAGFLDPERPQRVPLRRLWLESCALSPYALHFLGSREVAGLESLRIRRLDAASLLSERTRDLRYLEYRLSRGGMAYPIHDGAGGWTQTSAQLCAEGMAEELIVYSDHELRLHADSFDAEMWNNLPEVEDFILKNQLDVDERDCGGPQNPMRGLLEHAASSLTSLNLDWIYWRRQELDPYDDSSATLTHLATLKFPNLRAFQLRNAVMQQTLLPEDTFLLEVAFLGFLEYHRKLQCLAWPMDRFYGHKQPSVDVQARSRTVVAHLATVLTELRVDAHYTGDGEPFTDIRLTMPAHLERIRRRRFIAEFAPHMRRLERLKVEGGVPRDEKREILRALHYCSLKKIVMIGVCFPVGNTWGHHGVELKDLDEGPSLIDMQSLQGEDEPRIREAYRRGSYMANNFVFEPDYGWPAIQVPLLQTAVLHHAKTVEELKICGYHGCPILSHATPITDPLLNSLRHFENLKVLVMSFWLLTWFESDYRDSEIIKFWMDSRSPSSTALVVVTPPQSPPADHPVDPGQFLSLGAGFAPPQPQFNRWAVALKTSFSPSALAYRVARDIGPYLSPVAKNRPGGIRVRASFCVGVREERHNATDIFDLDVRIGMHDQVLEFTGPREEGEKSRWWQKLEDRSWF
ncbi:hypothetical protein CC86DRAFT_65856 [Ophiobolus disseminans]|uniref:F-box domain-containing protein n=1 Tax=Ophiobolus disseminans TaxID=1469910 RepID=A0A6A6ZR77_9PLEO|nr:hypothetical protein CC86DRAFT_65856 [Ophiobolus disseminans]